MLNFIIPDSFNLHMLNLFLIKDMQTHPEEFNDVHISGVYGCPAGCMWNGGRVPKNEPFLYMSVLEEKYKSYYDYGVNYNITLTNLFITDDVLNDHYGNSVVSLLNIEGNSAIVSTDTMKDYIQNNYRNLKIITSVTANPTIEEVNRISKNNIIVLPVKYMVDESNMKKLENPESVELLVNGPCRRNCPNYTSQKHYIEISKANRYLDIIYFPCQNIIYNPNVPYMGLSKTDNFFLDYEDCVEYNRRYGITHFKLSGREYSPRDILAFYIPYFVKPEYHDKYLYRYNTLIDYSKTYFCNENLDYIKYNDI